MVTTSLRTFSGACVRKVLSVSVAVDLAAVLLDVLESGVAFTMSANSLIIRSVRVPMSMFYHFKGQTSCHTSNLFL